MSQPYLHCPFIDPILGKIGPFSISWYGLMYTCAAIVWIVITRHEIIRRSGPIPVAALPELLVHGLVGAILGARLGYVVVYNLPHYMHNPWETFAFWHGGMSFHGGLLGMGIGGILFARRHSISIAKLADVAFLGVPLGLTLFKIGNFINCEGFGVVTMLPWGIVSNDKDGLPLHPVQLYEAVFEGLLLFLLLWKFRTRARLSGDVCNLFLVGYGSFRFILEFFREPDKPLGNIAGWLSTGQILSLFVILVGLVGHFVVKSWEKHDVSVSS